MKVCNHKIQMILILIWTVCLLLIADVNAKQNPDRVNLTGEDLSAWRSDTGQWKVVGDTFLNQDNQRLLGSKSGTGVILNGPTGRTSHLISKEEFSDIRAHIEFMIPKRSNSGVYFAGRYEIQIYDSYGVEKAEYPGIECGGIYERWDEKRTPKGYEGHSPRVNVSREPGRWQSYDVIFRAPRFDEYGNKIANARFEKVIHNGVIVHEDVELTGPTRASAYNDEKPTGPLMLQGDHGPVAYRNIWIESIGPDPLSEIHSITDKENKPDFWIPREIPKAHYKIECSINPDDGQLQGTETIGFKNTINRPISLLGIKWLCEKEQTLEIMVDGEPALVFKDTGSEITVIELQKAIDADEEIDIEIKFGVRRTEKMQLDVLPLTGWYPRLWWGFETHDDFDVKVDVPKEYKITTSGLLNGDTGYYHAEGVRSFGLVLLKGTDVIEAKAEDVIVNCYYRTDERKCAELLTETAVDVINFYRERFGFYPQSNLNIIPGAGRPMGGYPVATNVVCIHGMARMDEKPELHWKWITAHEVGHQYWLEYVLSKDSTQQYGWLMIGLGIYADREYVRAKGLGMDKHQGLMNRYIQGVREGHDTTVNISEDDAAEIDFDFNNVVIHGKGYSIISALDCLLGDEIFDKIYNRCLKEFGGRRLGAKEFQAVCEAESGQDLEWFFGQWLNSNRYLSYEISSKNCESIDNMFICEIEVKRLGDLRMPVPVEAVFEDGSREIKLTNRLLDTNIVRFESKSALKQVRLDPENALALIVPPPSVTEQKLRKEIQKLSWTGAGKEALEIFKKATQANLLNERDWFKLGLTLYDGKYNAESLKAFESAANQAEKSSTRYFTSKVWQGHILDLLNKRDEALECYKEALKCEKKDDWVRHDQYGMKINHDWVKQRIEKPFVRNASDR